MTQEAHPFRTGFVAIVGRPNVGKSTLLNQLVGERISITSKKAQTTRHRVHGILTNADAQYVFVDTPGFQKKHTNALHRVMNRTVTQALQDVDVILYVLEAGRYTNEDKQVVALLPKTRPVILVANKTDAISNKETLLPWLASMQATFPFAALVPVSAEKGYQLEALLQEIKPRLPEQPAIYDMDEMTDRDERFLATEFVREKMFRLLGEEVPYAATVVIEHFVLEGDLRRIHAAIVVERDNQKAIVIGRGGEKIKRIASEARQDMERLFQGKVYLELWVKVKSGWADDERMVRSFGYE